MRRSRLRRLKNRTHTLQEVNVLPLVDVALTLLIIFMVATPMMHNIIKVELPSSRIDDSMPQSHTQQAYLSVQVVISLDLLDLLLQFYEHVPITTRLSHLKAPIFRDHFYHLNK